MRTKLENFCVHEMVHFKCAKSEAEVSFWISSFIVLRLFPKTHQKAM